MGLNLDLNGSISNIFFNFGQKNDEKCSSAYSSRGPTAYLCVTEAITVALLPFSCQLPIYL